MKQIFRKLSCDEQFRRVGMVVECLSIVYTEAISEQSLV